MDMVLGVGLAVTPRIWSDEALVAFISFNVGIGNEPTQLSQKTHHVTVYHSLFFINITEKFSSCSTM